MKFYFEHLELTVFCDMFILLFKLFLLLSAPVEFSK